MYIVISALFVGIYEAKTFVFRPIMSFLSLIEFLNETLFPVHLVHMLCTKCMLIFNVFDTLPTVTQYRNRNLEGSKSSYMASCHPQTGVRDHNMHLSGHYQV